MSAPWDQCNCCGTGSGIVTAVVYTMAYSSVGVVVGVLYGIVHIDIFEADLRYSLRVAFGIMIAWSILQLLVSIPCLVGVYLKKEGLLTPFAVVKFFSVLLYLSGGIAIAAKAPKGDYKVNVTSPICGIFFALLEFFCMIACSRCDCTNTDRDQESHLEDEGDRKTEDRETKDGNQYEERPLLRVN